MGYSTITFSELRERSNRGFVGAEFNPLDTELSPRIKNVMEERAVIETLATTQPQRVYFAQQLALAVKESRIKGALQNPEKPDASEWHNRFVRLIEPRLWREGQFDRHAASTEALESYRNTRNFRFQLLFSHDHQFIIPADRLDSIHSNLRIRKNDRPQRREMIGRRSLLGCLISADLVPDKLAEDLHIVDFEPQDRPFQRLAKKASLDAINRLKLLFESAVAINHLEQARGAPNERILVIRPPTVHVAAWYPNIAPPSADVIGTILYTREVNPSGNGSIPEISARKLSAQHYVSIYAAYRKGEHQRAGYIQEIETLSKFDQELKQLNEQIDLSWKPDLPASHREVYCSEATTLLTKVERHLRFCENGFKVKARSMLGAVSIGQDARGRRAFLDKNGKPNIAPFLTRVSGARTNFQKRYDEMFGKGKHGQEDQLMLQRCMASQKAIITAFCPNLPKNAAALEQKVASARASLDASKTVDVTLALLKFGADPEQLKHVVVRPFLTFVTALDRVGRELKTALANSELKPVQDAVIKIDSIRRFFEVLQHIEWVRDQIIRPDKVRLDDLVQFTGDVRKVLSERIVFPQSKTPEYDRVFEMIQSGLEKLELGLAHYERKKLSPIDRTAMFTRLKAYLDTLDVEEMVKNLK